MVLKKGMANIYAYPFDLLRFNSADQFLSNVSFWDVVTYFIY